MEPKMKPLLQCLYCSYTTDNASDLLDHEEEMHGAMVGELEGEDGSPEDDEPDEEDD